VVLDHGRLSQAFRALATDLGGIQKRPAVQPAGLLSRLSSRR
jgi:hypothetical protein